MALVETDLSPKGFILICKYYTVIGEKNLRSRCNFTFYQFLSFCPAS